MRGARERRKQDTHRGLKQQQAGHAPIARSTRTYKAASESRTRTNCAARIFRAIYELGTPTHRGLEPERLKPDGLNRTRTRFGSRSMEPAKLGQAKRGHAPESDHPCAQRTISRNPASFRLRATARNAAFSFGGSACCARVVPTRVVAHTKASQSRFERPGRPAHRIRPRDRARPIPRSHF